MICKHCEEMKRQRDEARKHEGGHCIHILVEALRETIGQLCNPISMVDARMRLAEIESICEKALAEYSKGESGK